MAGLSCVICTSEDEYTKRLCACINMSENYNIQVKAITSDNFQELVSATYDNVFVISTFIYEKLKAENIHPPKTIILCDEKEINLYEDAVLMYKPFDEIINNIIGIASVKMWIDDKDAKMFVDKKILAIISPTNNEYKSLCSLDIARVLSEQRRTLYINLETFSGIKFGTYSEHSLSDLIFLYETKSASYEALVKNGVYNEGNLYTINPLNNPMHQAEIDIQRLFEFIESLANIISVSNIVIDFGKQYYDYAQIFRYCNIIINVTSNFSYARRCNMEFCEYLKKSNLSKQIDKIKTLDPKNIYVMDSSMETSSERRGFISTMLKHLNI